MTDLRIAPRDGVEDQAIATADGFLDALSPRYSRWSGDPLGWVFRGQADADWELRSKAARSATVFEEYGLTGLADNWSNRRDRQDELLEMFRDGLNRSGLVIPMRAPRVIIRNEYSTNAEPEREAFPLMALAQHHGLPTMLLDWTRRGWVAAYFAAVEAADPKKASAGQFLAVWALHRSGFSGKDWKDASIFYEAPGGTNPNLNAQSGLFTIHHGEENPSLETHLIRLRSHQTIAPMPHRLHLPVSEAPRLLKLLAYEGVTGASMFPGPDGVVRSMRERALWQ